MRSKSKPAAAVVPPAVVHNHTGLTLDEIKTRCAYLGTYRNLWRQRSVALYRFAEGKVISVGVTFDGRMTVVAIEEDGGHARALDAFAHGRSYTAE